jgi:hypothetical protein
MQNLDELANPNKRPSLVFYDLAMDHFGVAFGDPQMHRISPSNISYPDVYLDKDRNVSLVMDDVVDGIISKIRRKIKAIRNKTFYVILHVCVMF